MKRPLWKLDADKVLRHAQQLESVGQAYYRRAAEARAADPALKDVLAQLADEEGEHEKTFRGMRDRLAEAEEVEAGPPPGEDALAAMLDRASQADPLAALEEMAALDSAEKLLVKAMEMEDESVAFYTKMKGFLADPADAQAVDAIIAEECRHREVLRDRLDGLAGEPGGRDKPT